MRIDGLSIAKVLLGTLSAQIKQAKTAHMPTASVYLLGNDPSSSSYVAQKYKAACTIGASLQIRELPSSISFRQLKQFISLDNNNPLIHGIIVQRPLPPHLSGDDITYLIKPSKDIDGFLPKSPYAPPVGEAVLLICYASLLKTPVTSFLHTNQKENLVTLLKEKTVMLVGKGETGGKPISKVFDRFHIPYEILHSGSVLSNRLPLADIIISAVGKPQLIHPSIIKKGVLLISVGISRNTEGKLHGDYNEHDIQSIASDYTPTPEGVGPVNVACLLKNLVDSWYRLEK